MAGLITAENLCEDCPMKFITEHDINQVADISITDSEISAVGDVVAGKLLFLGEIAAYALGIDCISANRARFQKPERIRPLGSTSRINYGNQCPAYSTYKQVHNWASATNPSVSEFEDCRVRAIGDKKRDLRREG